MQNTRMQHSSNRKDNYINQMILPELTSAHIDFNSDESDCPYMEEYIEQILRSPLLSNQTTAFDDSEEDRFLSSTSFQKQNLRGDSFTTNNIGEQFITSADTTTKNYLPNLPPSNAVHMEIQENAKVPNIYHVAIDRSAGETTANKAVDDLVSAEAFFDPSLRYNASTVYIKNTASIHTAEHGKLETYLYTRRKPLPIPGPKSPPDSRKSESPKGSLVRINSQNQNRRLRVEEKRTELDLHSAPALIEASKIRSRFGFGSNHVVPSVPLPPPKTALSILSNTPVAPIDATAATGHSFAESASFYERKKQKAKDSRVKLNDSIDKLSVAINVAGSQSKLRASQYTILCGREERSPSSNAKIANGLRFMEDAAKSAESARKWDRPSFVGLAATMIQDLNSQCEFLFSELQSMHSYVTNQKVGDSDSTMDRMEKKSEIDLCKTCGTKLTPSSSTVISIDMSMDDITDKDLPSSKRLKISHPRYIDRDSVATIMNVLTCPNAACLILSFLAPQSFVRCSSLSKAWRQVLLNNAGNYWLTQCIKRFGTLNVRRWEDIDAKEMNISDQDMRKDNYYMNLYRRMNAMNVKPACMSEGSLRLGEGRRDQIVSAWVSAMVRSNGETLRSVQRSQEGISYAALNVVELRLLIQNTGSADNFLYIPEQLISVDASTKRRSEEFFEITTDERLLKVVTQLDGSPWINNRNMNLNLSGMQRPRYLCVLRLYECAVIIVHIHAHQCSTAEKFRQKAKFMKLLVCVNGATVPLVIPFTSPAYMKSLVCSQD